jgi:hypothetical protein
MPVLERIDLRISNMSAMLTRAGIDPDLFRQQRPNSMFRASMHACQSCPNGDICTRWLEHAPVQIDRVPEFCPNGQRFERAREMIGSH